MAGPRHLPLIVLTLVSLSMAQPSVATWSDPGTEESIENPAQRFGAVQALTRKGELDAALRAVESLRNDYPQDVDYMLARAQILAEQNRDELALDELSVAIALAPDYEDLWILHFNILARRSGPGVRAKFEIFRDDAAARFPVALWWQKPTSAQSRWTLIAGGGHDRLSNNQPSWNSQFAELQFEQNAAFRYQFQLTHDERYAGADSGIRLGVEHAHDSGWLAGFELSTASTPNFQPKVGYSGHISKALPDAWLIDLRYRRREYSTTAVSSVTSTVEKYVADFRVAYSLGLSQLSGSSPLANHGLTGNWYYADESSVGISVTSGQEAESIGNNSVLETDTRGVSLMGRHALNDRLGLHWWLGLHEQGDFYRRRFIGMALSIRI